jgi:hypothetical protein
MTCEEGVEAAVCMLEAIDGDADGARSALCKSSPGDDCDDENAAVHPGVAEVCDGVDNDCDGKSDLQDGLSLAGEATPIAGANELQLAWSEAGGRFFVVYPTGTGVNKATLTTSGIFTPDSQLFATEPATRAYTGPIIASGGPNLLITHVDAGYIGQGDEPPGDLGYTLSGTGSISGAGQELVGGIKDFAWRSPTEDWVMAQVDDGKIVLNAVSTDLTVKKGSTYDEHPSALHIASTGTESALVWQVKDSSLVVWARVLQGLALIGRTELSKGGHQPDIIDVKGGYAIAWTTGTGVALARRGTDATAICESGVVDLGLSAGDGNRVALADSDRGVLALVTSQASNKASLVRFDSNCKPVDNVIVADTASPGSPSIDVGARTVALAWSTTSAGGPAYTRVVSDLLCK